MTIQIMMMACSDITLKEVIGIDFLEISTVIVDGLNDYTGLLLVDTDNPEKRPKYPFLSYKFTSIIPFQGEGNYSTEVIDSNDEKFEHDITDKVNLQPQFIISFQAYSNDPVESMAYIQKVCDYFKHGHKENGELEDINVVVVEVMNSQDRSTLEVNNYEYRWGVDVRFRTTHEVEIRREAIENIEEVKIGMNEGGE